MKLTAEQEAIINSNGNIKINAVAGSGKTTTVVEYARTRPAGSRILYLAFNRSVKIEAAKKFQALGLDNVQVETAHSIAHRHVVWRSRYALKSQSYRSHELVELLKLESTGEKHTEHIVANHVLKFAAYFCNCDKDKVQELNYLELISDAKAKAFVKTYYSYIENQTRLFLSKMNSAEIEITHDFYLKKFQLQKPELNFDYILFDEGQDASPAMLDIFLRQSAVKVIVGDTHQQIYGWRHAVNSLEKTNFQTFHLTNSFRFGQDIANLATGILDWKGILNADFATPGISGMAGRAPADADASRDASYRVPADAGISGSRQVKAPADVGTSKVVLARTNLGLLLKAIEYITEKKNIKNIYFEGNINSYTYADDGASLYDVLNLFNGKKHLIKDALIKTMRNMEELEDYIDKTEDVQLGMMVDIVYEYGNEIPDILKQLKEKHVDSDQKDQAEMIFSTVHRAKGMEYDIVQLVDDFITEEKIEKQAGGSTKLTDSELARINEEINLLYVAVTRTRQSLYIPEPLLPLTAEQSPSIVHMKVMTKEDKKEQKIKKKFKIEIEEKEDPKKTGWSKTQDRRLIEFFYAGISLQTMSLYLGKPKSAIGKRVKELKLEYN